MYSSACLKKFWAWLTNGIAVLDLVLRDGGGRLDIILKQHSVWIFPRIVFRQLYQNWLIVFWIHRLLESIDIVIFFLNGVLLNELEQFFSLPRLLEKSIIDVANRECLLPFELSILLSDCLKISFASKSGLAVVRTTEWLRIIWTWGHRVC